jgi:hypothetical protein
VGGLSRGGEGVALTPLRVGALQLVSNMEAVESTKLYDLWDFSRHLGQPVKLGGGREPFGQGYRGRKLVVHRHQFARLRLIP